MLRVPASLVLFFRCFLKNRLDVISSLSLFQYHDFSLVLVNGTDTSASSCSGFSSEMASYVNHYYNAPPCSFSEGIIENMSRICV